MYVVFWSWLTTYHVGRATDDDILILSIRLNNIKAIFDNTERQYFRHTNKFTYGKNYVDDHNNTLRTRRRHFYPSILKRVKIVL